MTNEILKRLDAYLDGYFKKNNWKLETCSKCGKAYFSKKNSLDCGRYACQQKYTFLSLPKRKNFVFLEELLDKTNCFFNQQYKIVNGKSIINERGDTLFTTAGVQCLDKIIYENAEIPKEPFFIAQPSLRVQNLEKIGKTEGSSTSFVNICTEEINCSIENHIKHIDSWLRYLSRIGLFVSDMNIVKSDGWRGGNLKGSNILVEYGGLELGDVVYIYDIPQEKRTNLTISDSGFGLERICWALNKNESYFEIIGPLNVALKKKEKLIDFVRSLTLMAGFGVGPSNKSRGYRFRQFAKKSIEEGSIEEIDYLLPYFYNFWNKVTPLTRPFEETKEEIRKEINRNFNLSFCKKIGTKPPEEIIDKDNSTLIEYLIKRGMKLNNLKDILNKK